MSSVCPSGHDSASDDYCDVCGLPIPAGSSTPAPAADAPAPADPPAAEPAPATTACPNCQASNPPNALFCEACGYDFTTGSMPRPVTPPTIESVLDLGAPSSGAAADAGASPAATGPVAPATPVAPPLTDGWVAEVWIDPDWYADQESIDPLPSAGVPVVVPLRTTSILVGRTSRSRGIHPDIDLGADNGISRRHCQLTTDGTRWWVEDLGSSNGSYLGSALGPLPKTPVPPGEKREIGPDDRVYLGAWTRIVIRKAQPGEV
ncbi:MULTISPECIES: FHA domain-containing protein [unclassified Nocardioides]|uniref:FHA domain-containing protein n=1 Tax=unclassified Nocardioides TaxID=2615069 RepID=UPI00070346F0|nr:MULTISPECIES: FHA domain-containing protein [unclassified Nocardioides]KRC54899.1 phosphopeptide-binding protein [Nocardioides sp. Root79]KRC73757.1 phosphopeptide-binding protein [Nocardioides sp. Root240]